MDTRETTNTDALSTFDIVVKTALLIIFVPVAGFALFMILFPTHDELGSSAPFGVMLFIFSLVYLLWFLRYRKIRATRWKYIMWFFTALGLVPIFSALADLLGLSG